MSTNPASASAAPAIDPQNPWLGLASFTEETRAFFHGRDEEVAELGRRVQRKLLTILFGQSGLGKTSILRAGIVPRLRPEGYCPVYVRIDYAPESPPPAEQIKQAIFRATQAAGHWAQSGVAREGESLWEFLHHRDDVLKDAAGRTLVPLLIFDQFEEIFTLAQTDATGRARAQAFLADLADLVENRPPAELEARIERDEVSADTFDFTRADYRLLIALREDYLAHLEGLKNLMPSVTQNRMRLACMTGVQALAAVTRPGRDIVSEEVAASIVRFVAGVAELDRAEVEPSLLSLVCRELNETRRARGHAEISADLLAGSRETILSEFYERALADQPPGVRIFIESELLTDSGYRESIAEERVRKGFAAAGAPAASLAALIDRRLLRVEERLDVRRVELTHDVLCAVVAASRNLRHEREAKERAERQLAETRAQEIAGRRSLRRARMIAAVCGFFGAVAIASAILGYLNLRRARVAEAHAETTRRLAETSRSEAEKLVGFLLDDFYDELAPTGRLEIVDKLARQAVAYYDGLPPELRTPATQRNRAMALMRQGYGSLLGQGDALHSAEIAAAAIAEFEKLRAAGDRSEETVIGLALSLGIRGIGRPDPTAANLDVQQAVELLRPMATAAGASRRARLEYANLLNQASHRLPKEAGIAMCEEARRILAGLGALDLSDLAAASAYGDVSDSEARFAVAIGRLDDAERLERETGELADRILVKRPGDLRAMQDRVYAPQLLARAAAVRFHYGAVQELAQKTERGAEDYVRFNPSDVFGWSYLIEARRTAAIALELQGRVTEALAEFHAAEALRRDNRGGAAALNFVPEVWSRIAVLEAQRGNRGRAEQALQEAGIISDYLERELKVQDFFRQFGREGLRLGKLGVLLALDDEAPALREATESVAALKLLFNRPEAVGDVRNQILALQHPTEIALTQVLLRLRRPEEAEAVAREWMIELTGENKNQHAPSEAAAVRSLLALAVARQGRGADALTIVAPALEIYRELRTRDADGVDFRHDFAFALYVQALARADDADGLTQRRAGLDEAAALLDGLTDEAKQLHDQRELMGLIAGARTK